MLTARGDAEVPGLTGGVPSGFPLAHAVTPREAAAMIATTTARRRTG
jgi:hypothetical protein